MRKRNQCVWEAGDSLEIRAVHLTRLAEESGRALSDAIDLMRLLLRATSLKPKPGIYFLLNEAGDLIYVGQSDNVLTRMGGHGGKKFHEARMIHVPGPAERDRLEQAFIHAFVPPLNVQLQAYNRSLELRAIKRIEQKAQDEQSMIDAGKFIEELEDRHTKKAAIRALISPAASKAG